MKKILLALLIVFVAIQFIRPAKNIHAQSRRNNISTLFAIPENVDSILIKACKDCHSNNTRYPWYNNIQPVAWWMNDHINTGKYELNFDEFTSYKIARQYDRMKSIKYQVNKGEMPMQSYTLIHTDARLTDEEKNTLISWSEGIKKELESKYPKDSLEEKETE